MLANEIGAKTSVCLMLANEIGAKTRVCHTLANEIDTKTRVCLKLANKIGAKTYFPQALRGKKHQAPAQYASDYWKTGKKQCWCALDQFAAAYLHTGIASFPVLRICVLELILYLYHYYHFSIFLFLVNKM